MSDLMDAYNEFLYDTALHMTWFWCPKCDLWTRGDDRMTFAPKCSQCGNKTVLKNRWRQL